MLNLKKLGPQINSSDIITEIRELAVAWGDHYNDAIWNKFKLASDIQYCLKEILFQFGNHIGCEQSEHMVNSFLKHKISTDAKK